MSQKKCTKSTTDHSIPLSYVITHYVPLGVFIQNIIYEFVFLSILCDKHSIPADSYLFKVNRGNTKMMCEIFSKLTIKILERRQ